jgi:single-strand DNA-binding protein
MSEGLNKWMGLGNLAADPELRVTSGGQAVLKLRLACSESYLDRNKVRQERTEFLNVVVWGKRAEGLAKILTNGSRIFVEGSLRTSSYDDRDGNKRYKTEINVTNVLLCGGSRGGEGGGGSRSGGNVRDGGGGDADGGQDDFDYGGNGDDDIPFVSAAFGAREGWWL